MAGNIDFADALRERVALLAGLELAALHRPTKPGSASNPEAAAICCGPWRRTARAVFWCPAASSFSPSASPATPASHAHRANSLLDDGMRLTGGVAEPILGREAKLVALIEEAAALGVGLEATLAVGDGANDLAMIEAAGLGVAYRAKPIVAERADARLDFADLSALLYFQGYGADAFA